MEEPVRLTVEVGDVALETAANAKETETDEPPGRRGPWAELKRTFAVDVPACPKLRASRSPTGDNGPHAPPGLRHQAEGYPIGKTRWRQSDGLYAQDRVDAIALGSGARPTSAKSVSSVVPSTQPGDAATGRTGRGHATQLADAVRSITRS